MGFAVGHGAIARGAFVLKITPLKKCNDVLLAIRALHGLRTTIGNVADTAFSRSIGIAGALNPNRLALVAHYRRFTCCAARIAAIIGRLTGRHREGQEAEKTKFQIIAEECFHM